MMDGSDYDTSNVNFYITQSLPDVVITSITLDPTSPTVGSFVSTKATIKNQGTAATPNGVSVGVAFKVDGTDLGAFFVRDANGNCTSLGAGQSYIGTCPAGWAATAGTHTIWAKGDNINRFTESNDNNNEKTKSVTVK